jgi:hypothetical protein
VSSLILAGYNLLDWTSPVTVSGSNLGSPQALTEAAERLLTDGEIVTGVRSGNRTLSLPLLIRGDRATTAQAIRDVATFIDQPQYTIIWQPGNGLPVAFDCFRGQLTREYDLLLEAQGGVAYLATIPALPFTRTPAAIILSPTTGASVQIDALDNVTGLTTTGGTASADSTTKIEGTASVKTAYTTPAGSGAGTDADPFRSGSVALTWARTVTSVNLSAMATIAVRVTQDIATSRDWTLILSGSGWTATYEKTAATSGWAMLAFDLTKPTSTTGTVNLAAVTGWRLVMTSSNWTTYTYPSTVWLDDLRAFPAGSGLLTGPVGTARYDGVVGTARTPVSVQVVTGPAAARLLIARYPNPPAGFDPIITAGGGTADSTALSGSRKTSITKTVSAFSVGSTYAVIARAKSTGPVTFTVTAKITGDTSWSQTVSRTYTAAEMTAMTGGTSSYNLIPVGVITLPPRGVDPQNTATTVDITITSSVVTTIDQAYLCDLAGDTLLFDPPGTIAYTTFFLDAPSPSSFTGNVYGSHSGVAADRTDAVSLLPWVKGQPVINFTPGSNLLLILADPNNPSIPPTPSVTVSYYSKWASERAV